MVQKIAELKDLLIDRMEHAIDERGIERVDLSETSKLADQIKDLAEAEKACWEAEYYMAVTEAMENRGYMPEDIGDGMSRGYRRRGYNMSRDSRGRYSRGYHEELDGIREAMRNASPDEKEKMQRELRQMLNM